MSVYDEPDLLLKDPSLIKDILIQALRRGYLSLFIGAGVSMSTRLQPTIIDPDPKRLFPSWPELVERCCVRVGIAFDKARASQNDYLLRTAEAAEAECSTKSLSFLQVVYESLYEGCPQYNRNILRLDLLIALGSMVMTSSRGSASAVINYNFDDLLEWYLILHGYTVSVVSDIPTLTQRADVVIYHPHGFLPQSAKLQSLRSKSIVFTKRDYQRAMNHTLWNEFQRFRFGCNISLFVGLSGDDQHIEWLYSSVHDDIKGKRILGVVVLLDSPENREREQSNKARGLLHLYIPSHDALPDFLLDLCRGAAEV
jgi:hypothetical protein